MMTYVKSLVVLGMLAMLSACASDKPHDYGQARPPVDQLDSRDRGLQSKDVIAATDQLARDLLALPELRQSPTQWTVVVDRIQDRTIDRSFYYNYDIFLERFRTNLSQLGPGRIRLIENKATFNDIRNRELDSPSDLRQGQGVTPVQPNYALYGKALDMPNRATNYYLIQFDLVNLATREQVWSRQYEVKVAR